MASIGFTSLVATTEASAQAQAIPDSLCQAYRFRLMEHAQLSDGVRRDIANRTRGIPMVQPPPPPPPNVRAEAIRARLQRIPEERQRAEDSRLASLVRLDFGRASQFEQQTQALDAERAGLERELAGLQAGASRPPAGPPRVADVDRVPCQDMAAALHAAVNIRQRELGAREGQPGVVPLVVIKGQNPDQIARDLARQFSAWPDASNQVGLLDQDGNGHVDAFVDVPVANTFRLYWQRADGAAALDVVSLPARPGDAVYGEIARRIEEATIRQTGRKMPELLSVHPAGPIRILEETGDFARAQALVFAGNYAEAARVEGGGMRVTDFQNYRGEGVRLAEMIAPTPTGLVLRRVVASQRGPEELWEETATLIRPTSQSRIDVEVRRSTDRRNMAGVPLAPKTVYSNVVFGVDR